MFYSTARGLKEGTGGRRGLARNWQREHAGFVRLITRFEDNLEHSRVLRASLARGKRGPVTRWLRSHGVAILLYYTLGAVFFHFVEGWAVLDCIYFMTVTAT